MTKFYSYSRDGITQGLLQTWMSCRKKAQLYLEGWEPKKFSPSFIYGTVIHGVLEKVYTEVAKGRLTQPPRIQLIHKFLNEIESSYLKEHKEHTPEFMDSLGLALISAEVIMPIYFDYWYEEDFKKIQWKSLEQEFKILFVDLKGRKTFMKGKIDGVFGKKATYLFETKTKSMVNMYILTETLWYDFQVNVYLWAIKKLYNSFPGGFRYNILRKSSLYKLKNETYKDFSKKLSKEIHSRPDFYFLRVDINVSRSQVENFERDLKHLVTEFIDWCEGKIVTVQNTSQCVTKYGSCPYMGLCSKNDTFMYTKRKTVFRELEEK